jgi:hypothetical protein
MHGASNLRFLFIPFYSDLPLYSWLYLRKASRFKILPEVSPFVYNKEKIHSVVTANLRPSSKYLNMLAWHPDGLIVLGKAIGFMEALIPPNYAPLISFTLTHAYYIWRIYIFSETACASLKAWPLAITIATTVGLSLFRIASSREYLN